MNVKQTARHMAGCLYSGDGYSPTPGRSLYCVCATECRLPQEHHRGSWGRRVRCPKYSIATFVPKSPQVCVDAPKRFLMKEE
jgi:hypothetical protein